MNYYCRAFSLYMMLLILIITNSCYDKSSKVIQRFDIEANIKNFQSLKLSELSESSNNIEYVKLETNDSSLIGDIKYLDISNEYILLYDWKKCLLFNRFGKFLGQISREGRGPGEYTHPAQIKIIKNEIFVPDASSNLIKIFDTNGNFIEEVKSPGIFSNQFQVSNYFPVNDSLFFVQIPNLTGQEQTRISLINRKGEILFNYKNTTFFDLAKPRFSSTDLAAQFYSINSNIRYKEQLNDTVWQIEKNKLIPVYVFDRGRYSIPNNLKGLPTTSFFHKLSETISIIKIFETEKFIFIKTNFMKQYPFNFYKQKSIGGDKTPYDILGFYDKPGDKFFFIRPTGISEQIEPTGIENDIDGGINFLPEYKVEDSLLVSWVNASDLKNYISSNSFKNSTPKYPEKKKELERLANSLDENDNPVLMLVKLEE